MPSSILVNAIYGEVIIRCQHPGCSELFIASVDGCEDRTEPVDAWAARAATEAEILGWTSGLSEHVFCPEHRTDSAVVPNPSSQRTGFAGR